MSRWMRGIAVAALLLGASSGIARAESQFILGGGGLIMPDYWGSDDYEVLPLPVLRFDWSADGATAPASGYKGTFGVVDASAAFPDGVDIGIARLSTPSRHFTLRLGGGYRFGRDADDNTALRGMGDIDGQGIARISLGSEPAGPQGLGVFFGLKYETDVTSETDGDTFSLYVGDKFSLSPSTTLTLTGRSRWADRDMMQSYFGVTDAQAARTGYAPYSPSSGFADVGVDARVNWALTDQWLLFGSLGYSRLMNDAADSPLVDLEGSANQFRATTGFAYRF